MAWLIVGCTLLIIICLGGGRRLAQLAIALAIGLGAAIYLFSNG
ncbi:MAG: hypothetical protein WA418_21445 [Bradyrhizobium sp.]|jgi:hypothetical protein